MVLTIATVSMCIWIVMFQHLYNWAIRKLWDKLEEDGLGVYVGLTILMVVVNCVMFNTLIEINK